MSNDLSSLSKRFTPGLSLVLMNAARLAVKQGKKAVEPTHLLFGLTSQQEYLIDQFFPSDKPSVVKKKRTNTPKDDEGIPLTATSQRILQYATRLADHYHHGNIDVLHLFASLIHSPNPRMKKIFAEKKINMQKLEVRILACLEDLPSLANLMDTLMENSLDEEEQRQAPREIKQKHQSALQLYALHLTEPSYAARLDPLIGRVPELNRLMRVVARRTKNNPMLLGDPGVGKTAIVEGLARNIVLGNVPPFLLDKKIFALNLTSMIAGSTFRGELEMRFKQLVDEVATRQDVILFIDEIHNIVGAGSSAGSMDVGNILKPALARGVLRCIGATTYNEYKKYIEDDPALERRFQSILVEQPSIEETERIVSGVAPFYEHYHGVTITPEAIHAAVAMSHRYLPEKSFPDKAIDVIDEAAAKARIDTPLVRVGANTPALTKEINPTLVAEIIASSTGIPLDNLLLNDQERLLNLESALSKRVVGQEHAKQLVSHYIRRAKSGLAAPHRPLASFAFLGPSGVGKTELAKALADEVFGPHGLIKLDMSEFSESFTISRLIGAPSGYVGYKEGGRLTEALKHRPHSLIVFDEIEKAHPKVVNILLQILEDGCLTDAAGKRIDFSQSLIILTSNLGTRFTTGTELGFDSYEQTTTRTKEKITGEMKEWFNAELINRLDQIIVFNELSRHDITSLVEQKLLQLEKRMSVNGLTLSLTHEAKAYLADLAYDPSQGGRKARQVVEQHLESLIAESLLSPTRPKPSTVQVSVKQHTLICKVK